MDMANAVIFLQDGATGDCLIWRMNGRQIGAPVHKAKQKSSGRLKALFTPALSGA